MSRSLNVVVRNLDKTGYSLTAGSYVVRASSTQYGSISIDSATSATATISSVTTTRAVLGAMGMTTSENAGNLSIALSRFTLTNATTVTGTKNTATGGNVVLPFNVLELF